MSSTGVGDALEIKAFKYIQRQVKNGNFGLRPECCEIRHKPQYFSRDRQKHIIFDISIEVYLPGSTTYSVLWLFECKNHKRPVEPRDAESFFSKIEQVAGAKGTIVSASSFQTGTVEFCRAKGIGLMRSSRSASFKWEMYRTNRGHTYLPFNFNDLSILRAISDEASSPLHSEFCFCTPNAITDSFQRFCVDLMADTLAKHRGLGSTIILAPALARSHVPHRSIDEIEELVSQVTNEIGYERGPVDLFEICGIYAKSKGLKVFTEVRRSNDEVSAGVLGKITFQPLEIKIFDAPDVDARRQRFTLAHELGHLVLGHSLFLKSDYCDEQDLDFTKMSQLEANDIRRLEIQANLLAACLLLPKHAFASDFAKYLVYHQIPVKGFGCLFLDSQKRNIANYMKITNALMARFNVSRSVVQIRLEQLGLLRDESHFARRVDFHRIGSRLK